VKGLSAVESAAPDIGREIVDKWSAPYRGWHYLPEHVIASAPKIPGRKNFKHTDSPCVYQFYSCPACRVAMGTYPASKPGGGVKIKAGSISASFPIVGGGR